MIQIAFVLLGLIHVSVPQSPGCDYSQNIQQGQTYYVYSPGYPNNYTAGSQCRWQARSPSGYNCKLVCSEINIPQSASCAMDRLLVSTTGNPQLSGAEQYCGRGTLNVISVGQNLSIGLVSSLYSPGGNFICQLTAVRSTVTPSCRCGYRNDYRIVGGNETRVNEYPMMAGIIDVGFRKITCGGAIIDKKYILTAAHCLLSHTINDIAVVVGEHDVTAGDSPATQVLRVSSFLIHPSFTQSNFDYDIGIVRVAQDITFSMLVGPACLPFKFAGYDFAGAKLTILGWGTLFPGGPDSDVLMKVDVNVVTQNQCRQTYSNLTPRQLCTYGDGKDACQDDSGGPLLYTNPYNGRLYHAAIVSYGMSCATDKPAVNTRVTSLLDWIVTNTPGADYCNL